MRPCNVPRHSSLENTSAAHVAGSRRAPLPVQAFARNTMFWRTCKRDNSKQADQAPAAGEGVVSAATLTTQQTMRPGPRVIPSATGSATTTTTVTAPPSADSSLSSTDTLNGAAPATKPGRLKLQMSVSYLPHPSKVSYGGEDAHFLSEVNGGAIGVADGVGGWQESGINPAEYSRSLMRVACAFLEGRDPYEVAPKSSSLRSNPMMPRAMRKTIKQQQEAGDESDKQDFPLKEGGIDPQGALHVAHMLTKLPGSSTALVMQLDDVTGQLHAANLGDSGFVVVRGGSVVLQSRPLEHYFDCPHQFGSFPDYVDTTDYAEGADKYTFALQQGDVIIAGTDGLWDNCFMHQILSLLPVDKADVQESARRISALARKQAQDANFESPYILECQQQGFDLPIWEKVFGARFVDGRLQLKKLTGGKIDDITVIVAMAALEPTPEDDFPRDQPLEEPMPLSSQAAAAPLSQLAPEQDSRPAEPTSNTTLPSVNGISMQLAGKLGQLSTTPRNNMDWKVTTGAAAVIAGI